MAFHTFPRYLAISYVIFYWLGFNEFLSSFILFLSVFFPLCSHVFKHILVFEAVGSGKGRVCSCKYTNLLLFVFLSSCLLPSIFHIFKHILEFEAVGRGMGRVCRRHSWKYPNLWDLLLFVFSVCCPLFSTFSNLKQLVGGMGREGM